MADLRIRRLQVKVDRRSGHRLNYAWTYYFSDHEFFFSPVVICYHIFLLNVFSVDYCVEWPMVCCSVRLRLAILSLADVCVDFSLYISVSDIIAQPREKGLRDKGTCGYGMQLRGRA